MINHFLRRQDIYQQRQHSHQIGNRRLLRRICNSGMMRTRRMQSKKIGILSHRDSPRSRCKFKMHVIIGWMQIRVLRSNYINPPSTKRRCHGHRHMLIHVKSNRISHRSSL